MKPKELKDTSNIIKVPMRYLPKILDNNDKNKQLNMLIKSHQLYKKGVYYTRDKVASFKNKKGHQAPSLLVFIRNYLSTQTTFALSEPASEMKVALPLSTAVVLPQISWVRTPPPTG
jgi:hypothetical protein